MPAAADLNRGVAAVRAALEPLVDRITATYTGALRDLAARCAADLGPHGVTAAAGAWGGPTPEQLVAQLRQRHHAAWLERHGPRLTSVEVEAMRRTYRGMGQALGVTFELTNPVIEGQVRDLPNRSTLPDSSWEVVRESLQDSHDRGESIPQAARRLRTDAAGIGPARGRMIARTELVSIANRGSITAARLVGLGGYKTWTATNDARTRNAHALANGQTVPLDASFAVMGEALDYPGDPVGSPANIIHCRCTVTYADTPDGFNGPIVEPEGADLGPRPDAEAEPAAEQPRVADGLNIVVKVKARREVIEDVAAGIDKLHRLPPETPDVWELEVREGAHSKSGTAGKYTRARYGDGVRPLHVQVNNQRDPAPGYDPRTTFAHEYGHHLDHWYLRNPDGTLDREHFASDAAAMRAQLEDPDPAVRQRLIDSGLEEPLDPYGEAFVEFFRQVRAGNTWERLQLVQGEYGRYLRSGREVWARAYSQWVGLRTGDEAITAGAAGHVARRPEQGRRDLGLDADRWGAGLGAWPAEEFKPIAEAIDALMRAGGMMPDA